MEAGQAVVLAVDNAEGLYALGQQRAAELERGGEAAGDKGLVDLLVEVPGPGAEAELRGGLDGAAGDEHARGGDKVDDLAVLYAFEGLDRVCEDPGVSAADRGFDGFAEAEARVHGFATGVRGWRWAPAIAGRTGPSRGR